MNHLGYTMAILSLKKISQRFGIQPLLNEVNLNINKGEKVCLLGRNGAGKSTLMKMMAGVIDPDSGSVEVAPGIKISVLDQTFPAVIEKSVYHVIAENQTNIKPYQIDKIISRLNIDKNAIFSTLSGGLKRKVLLAKSLANEPDILLLDEPTNHLDIESIQWLENFLQNYSGTLILVTHDRQLMQNVGTHFVEIDRGNLVSWRGDYHRFLEHKEYLFSTENKANQLFDKKLAQEEVWIRQGIKARRTRNEGRVRALYKMREEFKQRRAKIGNVSFAKQSMEQSGKEVFVVKNLSFSYNNKPVIQNFSGIIARGDKIGLLGANGVGKSTLIKLLLKQLEPTAGTVKHGTKLEVVYFDQTRQELNEEKNIIDNIREGSDYITVGEKSVHIISYLQDFLFAPERSRTPVKALSGGEKNRVLLAKLFTKFSNVIILDEPTNDLDIETLELLEEQLINYSGTVLLVSHDRGFINNIVTSTWVFEGNGKVQEYAGGYDDWLLQAKTKNVITPSAKNNSKQDKTISFAKKTKLSYEERRELNKLPALIEKAEHELSQIQLLLSSPDFYQKNPEFIAKSNIALTELQQKLAKLYARWEELEQKS